MDVGGGPGTHVSILPAGDIMATLKPEAERPRCSSTPCSPIRGLVAGYQILHMDANYLVGFTTGEELLKLAHSWSPGPPEKSPAPTPAPPQPAEAGAHRASRACRGKHRSYQPYDIPVGGGGRRRRRTPSSSEALRAAGPGEPRASLHASLPLCLLKGTRAQSKSLDYLNLDRITSKECSDTEVLQYQLQHLTLRSERVRSKHT